MPRTSPRCSEAPRTRTAARIPASSARARTATTTSVVGRLGPDRPERAGGASGSARTGRGPEPLSGTEPRAGSVPGGPPTAGTSAGSESGATSKGLPRQVGGGGPTLPRPPGVTGSDSAERRESGMRASAASRSERDQPAVDAEPAEWAMRPSSRRASAAVGRSPGSGRSSRMSSAVNGPAWTGGCTAPAATEWSRASALSSDPKGGMPSTAA